ncbi:protein-tyrosine phosphatase family protein [Thermosphaera aggregans]|jgi:protein-tyrosine phosphatase|uniref:Dual specificity protein phosphatase n=1 Tax=Thermosphaera aggregans (strain DSM 11486 / M11TL) TaxID=633148 RepID=D5U0U1_THEAM|nr:dual specificity protein phosphatase family protein [Thermosphaera aggregans]ADG90741.1 dual specificity protein phosphatase [Thermosphaera aggregans DSM 11486]
MYKWIIEGKLAQAPFPSLGELADLRRLFDAIIVLTMPHEQPLNEKYIEILESHGFQVLHVPTLDFHPLELFDLLKTSIFIDENLERSHRVLVHCMGGIGRSGLVTAAYLIFKGYDIYDAVKHVRTVVPGAIENRGQALMLENYYTLVKSFNRELLRDYGKKIFTLGDPKAVLHASKTTQFTIELLSNLHVNEAFSISAMAQSLLHFHDVKVRSKLKEVFENMEFSSASEEVLSFIHLLDFYQDGRVVLTIYDYLPDRVDLILLCKWGCDKIVEVSSSAKKTVEKLVGRKVSLSWANYLDYV